MHTDLRVKGNKHLWRNEKMYKKPCRTGSQQLTSDISTLLKSVKK